MTRPIPNLSLRSIYELTPARLNELGIRFLLLDLDNTLAEYGCAAPEARLIEWLKDIEHAGVEPFILSNNRHDHPARFSQMINIGFVGKAKKPNPAVLLRVMKEHGYEKSETALVGDQIYTDIFCARRAGVLAAAVRPVSIKAPHRAVRYAAEAPFRLFGRIINGKNKY